MVEPRPFLCLIAHFVTLNFIVLEPFFVFISRQKNALILVHDDLELCEKGMVEISECAYSPLWLCVFEQKKMRRRKKGKKEKKSNTPRKEKEKKKGRKQEKTKRKQRKKKKKKKSCKELLSICTMFR